MNNIQRRKVCIIGASGKLGQYLIQHALARGDEVVAVCREQSVPKLASFAHQISIVPGFTNDRAVLAQALAGCHGVLTVLVPWGVKQYSSGTAQAVLDLADDDARLIFSCGWHVPRDSNDKYSKMFRATVRVTSWLGRALRIIDVDDQVEASQRIFASNRSWTLVRGSDLVEGDSEGLPVWSRHVGDPILESNITRRTDFALFMLAALDNDDLIHEAPAIVGCKSPSALAYATE